MKDDRSSRTIIFRSNHQNHDDTTSETPKIERERVSTKKSRQDAGPFHDRKKLSHRLLVWISKSDAAAAASASEGGDTKAASRRPGEGMYRSEMIPISSLFRKPKELMRLSDDEDD